MLPYRLQSLAGFLLNFSSFASTSQMRMLLALHNQLGFYWPNQYVHSPVPSSLEEQQCRGSRKTVPALILFPKEKHLCSGFQCQKSQRAILRVVRHCHWAAVPVLCADLVYCCCWDSLMLISHAVILMPACYRMGFWMSLIGGNTEVHCLLVCYVCGLPAGLFFYVCIAPCLQLGMVFGGVFFFFDVACKADIFSSPCKLWKNLKLL